MEMKNDDKKTIEKRVKKNGLGMSVGCRWAESLHTKIIKKREKQGKELNEAEQTNEPDDSEMETVALVEQKNPQMIHDLIT